MYFSLTQLVLVSLILPSVLEGFIPTSRYDYASVAIVQLQQQPLPSTRSCSWHNVICRRTLSLNRFMAFDSNTEDSNIFDGPMALTKERDACGVGFIANTQSGGENQNVQTKPVGQVGQLVFYSDDHSFFAGAVVGVSLLLLLQANSVPILSFSKGCQP
jgi:hypothetical protein